MNTVMTGVLFMWMAMAAGPTYNEMPKVASPKQIEVTVRFQLQRRTIITCGHDGCQIAREGQIAAKK